MNLRIVPQASSIIFPETVSLAGMGFTKLSYLVIDSP